MFALSKCRTKIDMELTKAKILLKASDFKNIEKATGVKYDTVYRIVNGKRAANSDKAKEVAQMAIDIATERVKQLEYSGALTNQTT